MSARSLILQSAIADRIFSIPLQNRFHANGSADLQMGLDFLQDGILLRHDVRAEDLEGRVAVERKEDPLVECCESGSLRLFGSAVFVLQ